MKSEDFNPVAVQQLPAGLKLLCKRLKNSPNPLSHSHTNNNNNQRHTEVFSERNAEHHIELMCINAWKQPHTYTEAEERHYPLSKMKKKP